MGLNIPEEIELSDNNHRRLVEMAVVMIMIM